MTPGIYKADWPGPGGRGGAIIVFMYNKIAGADQYDCIFDGEYADNAQGNITVRWLRVKIPPGVPLAHGGAPHQVEHVLDIPAFSFEIDAEGPFDAPSAPSPLSVKLTRLRRLEL
jgi:hypothetical protein